MFSDSLLASLLSRHRVSPQDRGPYQDREQFDAAGSGRRARGPVVTSYARKPAARLPCRLTQTPYRRSRLVPMVPASIELKQDLEATYGTPARLATNSLGDELRLQFA